ncbi:MAG TPA: SAM-dependent methyltransferase, partial [Candidatus Bathyarchaeia archaeon]|nr:SAM-dependent methyltransferase [Candidatus Bathyarchaeia archaeon]
TNVEKVTKGHPLTDDYFEDFETCYQAKPRVETDRFKRFSKKGIADRDYNLDIFWLKDESLGESGKLPDPVDLASEAMTALETASNALDELLLKLGNEKGASGV